MTQAPWVLMLLSYGAWAEKPPPAPPPVDDDFLEFLGSIDDDEALPPKELWPVDRRVPAPSPKTPPDAKPAPQKPSPNPSPTSTHG